MATEMYKLVRPVLRGVTIEIMAGVPHIVDGKHRRAVPNRMVNDMLGGMPQFKGDLVVGQPIAEDCHEVSNDFIQLTSAINLWVFWVYDIRTTGVYDLKRRLEIAAQFVETTNPAIQYVDHETVETQEQLLAVKRKIIDDNFFPGIVVREPFGTWGTEDEIIEKAQG